MTAGETPSGQPAKCRRYTVAVRWPATHCSLGAPVFRGAFTFSG